MEPTMQELRLFLVRETTRQWREIDERFLEMRLAGLVEGPMNEFGAGRWARLVWHCELGELWSAVQKNPVQFAALRQRFETSV